MSLKDLDIKISYAGKGTDILKQFLLPAINVSVHYDRVTSFYTVESLLAISQGIESLYSKQGKMRLIIGIHSIPEEFIDAVVRKQHLENQIKEIRASLKLGIESIKDHLEKKRIATIAWMIDEGLLEIKAANVKGEGIFHPKTLILSDEVNNKIVAIGSPNETSSGLGGNFEQVMVVQENWQIIRELLIHLHPAHLLTVRNTRKSLSEMGYKFPNRKLVSVSIPNSMEIELFYDQVNNYLSHKCFSVEEILYPDRKISIGFVRVNYQQRVASSLYSCKKSLERRLEKLNNLKENLAKM